MTDTVTTLAQDARNRALRTLLQGLGIDVLVAVGFVLYDALQSESPDYRLLLLSLLKTALVTVASFLMRLKTSIAAPPSPVPPPHDDSEDAPARDARGRFKGDGGQVDVLYLVGIVALLIGAALLIVGATQERLHVGGLIVGVVGLGILLARDRIR